MNLQGTIVGVDKIITGLAGIPIAINTASRQAIQLAVLRIHEHAVKMIQDNRDGSPARRYDPNRTVFVSDPGDPPNTDTGRLVQSVQFEFEDVDASFTGRVGTNLKYGAALEFGTSKMAPRPWLSVAFNLTRREVLLTLENSVNEAIKGAGK